MKLKLLMSTLPAPAPALVVPMFVGFEAPMLNE